MHDSRVARFDNAAVEEQSSIAVFGETGQFIEPDDPQPSPLKRLDQRIGKPLAELVKRDDPVAGNRRVTTAIAEGDAGEADPAGPDRSERPQQGDKHFRGGKRSGPGRPMIVETAEPGGHTEPGRGW